MLGGANSEAQMGVAVHRVFRWIDFVVSGEADLLFPGLCRTILDVPWPEIAGHSFPEGVLGPGHRRDRQRHGGDVPPRARVDDLDLCPIPDFGEYFETLAQSSLRDRIHAGMPVETSRGCWWGSRHHCSFCGLNGGQLAYRSRSAERVLDEFAMLTDRFDNQKLHVVDNILDRGHLKTVIPVLAGPERRTRCSTRRRRT
jgi:magnesium-protoporphyrin IX monomethyl ester (oxidative) cyclase